MPNPWTKEEQERINGIGATAMTVKDEEARESVLGDIDEAPIRGGMGTDAMRRRDEAMRAEAEAVGGQGEHSVYTPGEDPVEAERRFNEELGRGYFAAVAKRQLPDLGDVDMDGFSLRAMKLLAEERGIELPPDEEMLPTQEEGAAEEGEEDDAVSQEEAEQSVEVAKTSVELIRDSAEQIMDIVKELGDSVEELSDAPTDENLEMAEEMDAGMLPDQEEEQRPAVAAAKTKAAGHPQTGWDVYLNGKWIEKVFYDADMTDAEEIKKSLVNHDGFNPGIVVRKEKKRPSAASKEGPIADSSTPKAEGEDEDPLKDGTKGRADVDGKLVEKKLTNAKKVVAKSPEGVILFADGARGIYIPQYFAESIERDLVKGVSDEDWEILEAGPDHEFYWEAWDDVERSAEVVLDGHTYTLTYGEGGGDLFLICPELMTDEEKENFDMEPDDDDDDDRDDTGGSTYPSMSKSERDRAIREGRIDAARKQTAAMNPRAVKAIRAYASMHRRIDDADFAKVCAGLKVTVEAGRKVMAANYGKGEPNGAFYHKIKDFVRNLGTTAAQRGGERTRPFRGKAWTKDGSDITPGACRLMELFDTFVIGKGWREKKDFDANKDAIVKHMRPRIKSVSKADLEVLSDYNYHFLIEIIEDTLQNAPTAATARRSATAAPYYSISDGMTEMKGTIDIYPGLKIPYGGSSSPDPVYITKVENGKVYFKHWPYTPEARETWEDEQAFKYVAEKSLKNGIKNYEHYLKTAAGNANPLIIKRVQDYKDLLANKKISEGETYRPDPEALSRYDLIVKVKEGADLSDVRNHDAWYLMEEFGVGDVSGLNDGTYRLGGLRPSDIAELEADGRLEIVEKIRDTSGGRKTAMRARAARTEDEIRKDIRDLRRRMFDDGANEEEIKQQLSEKKNELNALLGGRILEDSFEPKIEKVTPTMYRIGFNYKTEKSDTPRYVEAREYIVRRTNDGRWDDRYGYIGDMAGLRQKWAEIAREAFDAFAKEENAKMEKHFAPSARRSASAGVGETILQQLGGNKFLAMTGAHVQSTTENMLAVKFPKAKDGINALAVYYDEGKDTYRMRFISQKGAPTMEVKDVAVVDDVYAEDLRRIFTDHTGLETSLGTMRGQKARAENTVALDELREIQNWFSKNPIKDMPPETYAKMSEEIKAKADRMRELMADLYEETPLRQATARVAAVKAGEEVEHPRFGKVRIEHIDDKTYSIPMAVFEVIDGDLKGEKIIRPAGEFDVTAAKKPGGIDVRQSKGKWEVVDRKDNDKVLGTHDSEEKAREQQKAIYASMNAKGAANPIDIGDGYYVHKVGYDRNGNWSVWVSKGANPAMKIQTNGDAPEAHRARGKYKDLSEAVDALSDRARDELKEYHRRFGAKATTEGGDAKPPFRARREVLRRPRR